MSSHWGLAVIMVVVSTCLAEPECYIDNKLLNKALGKTTFASSPTISSSVTVDGNRAEYGDTLCLATTATNPWLIVDLNERVPVSTVVFTAITAQGATIQYQVLVGDTFDAATFDPLTSGYEPCVSRDVSMVEYEVMYLQCERMLVGRYVLITKQDNDNLQVCEVEVYAEQVFQPEKWTCVRPELQRPTGLLNLGQGRGPNSRQISISAGRDAYMALDGKDYGNADPATGNSICTHNIGVQYQPWWLVDLGQITVIRAVAITNRNLPTFSTRLKDFKIFVGNLATPATSFVRADYEVCAYNCVAHPYGRKYYNCGHPIEGNHVAIALSLSDILSLCEVEIYSDINDVTLPSWPANNGVNQKDLYDNDDSTCIQLHQMLGWKPFSVEVPWDPTAKTGGVDPRSGYYHCRQDLYVNLTYTTGLLIGLSISEQQVHQASENIYVGKNCEVIGKKENEGLTRIRYACFCEVKCWVYIYVKHPRNMNTSDSRLCTINVYD